jgi:hypothetical protein
MDDQNRSGGDPPPERHSRRAVTIVAVLVLSMAAILSGSIPQSVATGRSEGRAVPPIYRMMYLPNDLDRRIELGKVKLIADCMAAHGLSYTPYVEPEPTAEQALAGLRTFGLESLDSVTTAPAPAEHPQSEEYARVLFGDPDQQVEARGERLAISIPATGCQADAEYRLLGDKRQRATELRLRLYDGERDAREQLDRDPIFKSITARWRACMNRARIDTPSPTEMLRALSKGTDITKDPVVRADLKCKDETGYLTVAYRRLAAIQQEWLDKHADILNEWIDLRHRQDTVARSVLGQN